jgi:hypothetical protein
MMFQLPMRLLPRENPNAGKKLFMVDVTHNGQTLRMPIFARVKEAAELYAMAKFRKESHLANTEKVIAKAIGSGAEA